MTAGGEPRIVVLPDPDGVADAAAELIAAALCAAAGARGRADWATTGGSAPSAIYRRLVSPPLRDEVPWPDVHVWWGDDRFVRRTDALSNVLPADRELLDRVPIQGRNVHPVPVDAALDGSHDAAWAAEAYERELRDADLPVMGGWPVFDLVLIGIGPDGHLLSVFPGSAALDEPAAWMLPIPAPTHVEPHVERVTLNPRVLDVAGHILVVVHGESKAQILGKVLGTERDATRLPAQLARRAGATWLLDEAAAAALPEELR